MTASRMSFTLLYRISGQKTQVISPVKSIQSQTTLEVKICGILDLKFYTV